MAYTVPKLTDYSEEALDKAAAQLLSEFEKERSAVTADQLKTFRDRWFARKNGILTQVNEIWLKRAPKEHKAEVGWRVNEIRDRIEPYKDSRVINESLGLSVSADVKST
ncbi:MAG: hypothetical protein DMG72_23055, partial [Acidobacteria bacterium]